MRSSTAAVVAAAYFSSLVSATVPPIFDEALIAQGLLGSHFGPIGLGGTYDYVIVGGGTAGLAMARRLAEGNTVAVVEAGGFYEFDNSNFTEIPADASYYLGKDPIYRNPLLDWGQQTTPQPGFDGVSTLYPSGHTLGGGSTRNFMWYQRGSTGSYQKWADAVGDDSYTFANLLPWFKKSVNFTPPSPLRYSNSTPQYNAGDFQPGSGPLSVTWPNFASPAASWLAKGLEAIGIKETKGMSDGNLFGWTWIAMTETVDQVRSTSESSFLREALLKTLSLQVYKNTLAKRVMFDSNKKATGVEVEAIGAASSSFTFNLMANKEVIVSGGAFRSPQMLMVSGVGPAATLQVNGIDVVADRPGVGQNMWDHVVFGPTYAVNTVTHGWVANPAFAAQATSDYMNKRQGILTNVGGDLLAFQNLPNDSISTQTYQDLTNTFGTDWPHIELLSLDGYTGYFNDFIFGAPAVDNFTAICAVVVSPFSRGNVSISSKDTVDHPIVNPNWLTDPRDQEVAVAAYKQARAALTAPDVQPILKGPEVFPGANVTSDEDILAIIRQSSSTIHHAAGTCQMGKTDDDMAVVDTLGRVIGVEGLRVVDASIFPILPPGHPQATIYALAEKISDAILRGQT